jgi:hypothetical protein
MERKPRRSGGFSYTSNSAASTGASVNRARLWKRWRMAACAGRMPHFPMGDPDRAAVSLLEGLVFDPGSSELAAGLAELYRQTAPASCAIRGGGAANVNLDCPLVHGQLCEASHNVAVAYNQNGQAAKALATARTAVQGLGCPVELFQRN